MPSLRHRGTLILCYHRVADGVDDPFHLCVSTENFASHLEEMTRGREPVTLSSLSAPSRRPRVVVTFDDGYGDNLHTALPIAKDKGVPVTIFVTSGMIGDDRGFWWDRLAVLLRQRPDGVEEIPLVLGDRTVRVPVGTKDFGTDLDAVRRRLLPRSAAEISGALDNVSALWSVSSDAAPDARPMTADELGRLASEDLVTIGAHTTDHVQLRGRPVEEQRRTVAASQRDLADALARPVTHFAFPFGGPDDFDDTSVDVVRDAPFDTACTTLPGTAWPATDRLRLPRRLVMNWGRPRFRAQMQRWKLG